MCQTQTGVFTVFDIDPSLFKNPESVLKTQRCFTGACERARGPWMYKKKTNSCQMCLETPGSTIDTVSGTSMLPFKGKDNDPWNDD